jgi:hypothetical protein
MSVESDKKKRNVITLHKKLDVNKRSEQVSVGRKASPSIRSGATILSRSNEYTEQGKVASTSPSIQCTRNRSSVLVGMEYLQLFWLDE